jgi:hypothetical protein
VRFVVAAIWCVLAFHARAAASASPLLPPDHWAIAATDRLEAVGLLDGWLPAQKQAPILAVAEALAKAEEMARRDRPDLLPLVGGWRERFAAEWPGADRQAPLVGAQLGAGYEATRVVVERPARVAPDALHLVDRPSDPVRLGGRRRAGGIALRRRRGRARDAPWK